MSWNDPLFSVYNQFRTMSPTWRKHIIFTSMLVNSLYRNDTNITKLEQFSPLVNFVTRVIETLISAMSSSMLLHRLQPNMATMLSLGLLASRELPQSFIRSLVILVGGLPTLLLPIHNHVSRILLPHRSCVHRLVLRCTHPTDLRYLHQVVDPLC